MTALIVYAFFGVILTTSTLRAVLARVFGGRDES
jgi:hypothetical protein